MDPHLVTAFSPFRFLDLPKELRNDIYEAAIFDLSPPDIFITPEETERPKLRKMSTGVLLLNRQVYREARDVIVRRGQLILVSVSAQRFADCLPELSMALSGITGIDPMHRNLCVMSHRIDAQLSTRQQELVGHFLLTNPSCKPEKDWEFILHQKDIQFFCRIMMGEFDAFIGGEFVCGATHTLSLHPPPTYGQHEFKSVHKAQELVLQEYRNNLRGFENFRIRGTSIGWESGLYGAVLQDVRSIDDREPTELLAEIRTLEQEGSQILLRTGDIRAADVSWVKALGICDVARVSLYFSGQPHRWDLDRFPKAFKSHVERWNQLRHQSGNACAIPLVELFYRLMSHRLFGALRFIEQGHHLATRHGHAPFHKEVYVSFVQCCCQKLFCYKFRLGVSRWSPQPSDEAQLDRTVAAIYRLLDATDQAEGAYRKIQQADELSPNDESIQQEKERIQTWLRRLVDNGTLETFPEP